MLVVGGFIYQKQNAFCFSELQQVIDSVMASNVLPEVLILYRGAWPLALLFLPQLGSAARVVNF